METLMGYLEAAKFNVKSENERVFILACENGDIGAVKLSLDDQNINYRYNYEIAFICACLGEHTSQDAGRSSARLKIVKLLLSLTGDKYINVHAGNEYAFRVACKNGHTDIVKLLLSLEGDRYINVHVMNELPFRWACQYERVEVMKLLLSLKDDRYINVHANNDQALIWACDKQKIHSVKVLLKDHRKIKLGNLTLNSKNRAFLLKIIISKIISDRRKSLLRRNMEKNKRIMLRELKSLPKAHIHNNFLGGNDYLKMLSKY